MNERIRELSYEAQRYALNNTTGPDLAGLNELWQEKFAELIVQECADLFEVEWGEEKLTGNDVGYAVKKHFGVEE
jgi:hypothetical protein